MTELPQGGSVITRATPSSFLTPIRFLVLFCVTNGTSEWGDKEIHILYITTIRGTQNSDSAEVITIMQTSNQPRNIELPQLLYISDNLGLNLNKIRILEKNKNYMGYSGS